MKLQLGVAITLATAFAALPPQSAHAACNLIPQTIKSFQGTLGVADRPYAIPGEWVSLRLDPVCHGASGGFSVTASDHVVTLVFTPPAGPNNVVILSTDCAALVTERDACEALDEVNTATCIPVNAGGPPLGLAVVDRDGKRYLRFRFPDTDALVGTASDARTLVGPATIAITTISDPLPCTLAAASCAETAGTRACIDELFESDGSCGTARHAVFGHFTALPLPNDYRDVCTYPPSVCSGGDSELRLAADAAGNLLIPVDWRGILVRKNDVPVPRLLRAASSLDAFSDVDGPIRVPNGAFVDSYTPEGGLLPPIFDPQTDPTALDELVLFGSADAPETVLRIARRGPDFRECSGGVRDGLACVQEADCEGGSCIATSCYGGTNDRLTCTADSDCPGGECGLGLFELRDRMSEGGVGPILVPRIALDTGICEAGGNIGQVCPPADCGASLCVDYRIEAQNPVPLEGIAETTDLYSFVIDEAIALEDLNGDGDTRDYVIELRDRDTGERLPVSLAVSRTHLPPFGYPALAVENNVAAFLEPDSHADDCTVPPAPACDLNVDGDFLDTFVRVYRDDSCCDLSGATISAEAEPVVDGKALVLSDGLVFFRRTEWMDTMVTTRRASVDSGGSEGDLGSNNSSISENGRYVAFDSQASNLVAGDTNGQTDVFVHDTVTGLTERVSVDSLGAESDGFSGLPRISADGSVVVFQSDATNLVAGDTNALYDVFVHDRDTGMTDRVSVDSLGNEADGVSNNASISSDGRYIAFASEATNLVAGDTNLAPDVFVHDRDTGVTERVSVDSSGLEANAGSGTNHISADGRYVVFASAATNLIGNDTNGVNDFYLRDRLLTETERVSIATTGEQADGQINWSPFISNDGRFVAFVSQATNLVANDDNGAPDAFVRDRLRGVTSRATLDSSGIEANGIVWSIGMSGDGRYVVFQSSATNLIEGGDAYPSTDVYVHDSISGRTELLNVDDGATQADGAFKPAISADGRFVSYASLATTLVAGPSNGQSQIYVRGLDASDLSADLTGDGDVEDSVLEVVDALSSPPADRTTLCPSGPAAVASGRVVFLRPEDAGITPSLADCPSAGLIGGNPDLNGDGDADDDVVHFWSNTEGVPRNLGLAAGNMALSSSWIAALVSECDEAGGVIADCGGGGSDLNDDGDAGDQVLYMHEICNPIASCSWTKPTISAAGQAADDLDVVGSIAAIATAEQDQGGQNLNGGVGFPPDVDSDDRVLQVYDADAAIMTNVGQAVEEFVIGDEATSCDGLATLQLIALRTSEQAQGGQILNDDEDALDDVLQVYDAKSNSLINTEQAITPCRLEACDPRRPYRVTGSRVRFLTFEPDQGVDLDGDGSATGLVLQSFDFCTATTVTLASVSEAGGAEVDPLAGSSGGATSEGAGDGEVLLTQAGRCFETLAGSCTTNADCDGVTFCDSSSCKREHGVCADNTDCAPDSTCEPDLIVATDVDADRDGVPDTADNCPDVANGAQTETQGGGVGDACVSAVCGNDSVESIEDCDGTADAACPGLCRDDCTCECTNVPIDPKAKVTIKAKNDSGVMSSKFVIGLGAYNGEAVSVRLDDADSAPIAIEELANLPARGKSGKKWLYKQRDDGIRKILLKDRTKKAPGEFLIAVKSKRWFSADAANMAAAETDLTLNVGSQCFTLAATKKVD